MVRKLRCQSVFLFAFIVAMAAGIAEGAEYALRLHHSLPAIAPAHHKMLVPWARKVERESGGRLSIEVHSSMALGGRPPQLINQVRDGVVDIVWTLAGYTPGRFPRLEVFELPFMNSDPVVMNLALHDFVRRYPQEFSEYKLIAVFTHFGQALHARKPVRSASDLQGMKIRVPSRMGGWIVSAMGAVPIGSPVSKIPELLSKGVIDAAMIPFEVVQAVKVDELVDYHITLGSPMSDRFNTQIFILAMNRDRYEALPADLQQVIDDNAGEQTARWFGRIWTENEGPGLALAAGSGELIRFSESETATLRARVEAPVHARWFREVAKKGLDGPALLAQARQLIDKHAISEKESAKLTPGERP
jgi:TRAP-type C4-dicarboxylate transport system substrate-binding protein